MKLSIIIASWNNQSTIGQTLQSILEQSYQNIEVWVIDGGSKDQTVEIIQSFQQKFQGRLHYISEKDQGISDAFNKGVLRATGDYIYFLGSDDYLWDKDVVSKMLEGVNPLEDWLICGKIARVSLEGKTLYITEVKPFHRSELLWHMALPHQGLLTHKNFFKQYGLFDIHNVFCMDYELLLRAYHSFPRVLMKDVVVAAWREGGVGANRIPQILKEYYQVKLKNKLASKPVLWGIYQWSLAKYYLKALLYKLGVVKCI
ncbi:MAG: glycosyl transferase, family 2 [Gammaproteobacteria bacterium]|jgi:glycosyltransferase involved in cell wall biosynthesis|nr:glycosyl transferase, family 2 [Gammaproteobacteria bacterium]